MSTGPNKAGADPVTAYIVTDMLKGVLQPG
jgi:hypothetical protein